MITTGISSMKNGRPNPRTNVARLGLVFGFVMMACPLLYAEPPTWQRHAIALPDSIWSVEAIDANADGQLDMIAMGQTQVFALTAPDWTPRVLIDILDPKMLYCVAFDGDGDGDQDIAVGRIQVPWIVYRQALAEGKEPPEKPRGPDFSVAWIENTGQVETAWPLHVIDTELKGIHGLCAGDVNGDGIEDVIADSIEGPFFPESMVWFEGSGGKNPFQRHIITHKGAGGRPHYIDFADLNGDGRGEVLLGDSVGNAFTWWEQGTARTGPWIKHEIAAEEGATNIHATRIDRNASMDIVASCGHGKGVFWFEGATWKKHIIDSDLNSPHALASGDFDGDGDIDVVAASYTDFIVRWYENDGDGNFTAHDIDTTHQQQAYDMKVVDLDGDGRLDFLLAGRGSENIVWYQNQE